MKYLSPFTLLGDFSPAGEDWAAVLRQARKRWMAEFELAGGDFIPINGVACSKAEVLAAIDSYTDPAALEFHRLLAAAKPLCAFLESGEIVPFHLSNMIGSWEREEDMFRAEDLFIEKYLDEVRAAWRLRDADRMALLHKIKFEGWETTGNAYYKFVETTRDALAEGLRKELFDYAKKGERGDLLKELSSPETLRLWKALLVYFDEVGEICQQLYLLMKKKRLKQEEYDHFAAGCEAALDLTLEQRWKLREILENYRFRVRTGFDAPEEDDDEEVTETKDGKRKFKPINSSYNRVTNIILVVVVLAIGGIMFGLWLAHRNDPPEAGPSPYPDAFEKKYVIPTGIDRGIMYYDKNGKPVPVDSVYEMIINETVERSKKSELPDTVSIDSLLARKLRDLGLSEGKR